MYEYSTSGYYYVYDGGSSTDATGNYTYRTNRPESKVIGEICFDKDRNMWIYKTDYGWTDLNIVDGVEEKEEHLPNELFEI